MMGAGLCSVRFPAAPPDWDPSPQNDTAHIWQGVYAPLSTQSRSSLKNVPKVFLLGDSMSVTVTTLMVAKASCLTPSLHTGSPNHCFLKEGMPLNAYAPSPFRTRLFQEALSYFLCLHWPLCLASLLSCGPYPVGVCCSLTSFYVLILCPQVVPADFVPDGRDGLHGIPSHSVPLGEPSRH